MGRKNIIIAVSIAAVVLIGCVTTFLIIHNSHKNDDITFTESAGGIEVFTNVEGADSVDDDFSGELDIISEDGEIIDSGFDGSNGATGSAGGKINNSGSNGGASNSTGADASSQVVTPILGGDVAVPVVQPSTGTSSSGSNSSSGSSGSGSSASGGSSDSGNSGTDNGSGQTEFPSSYDASQGQTYETPRIPVN